jgi:hypothetical protein
MSRARAFTLLEAMAALAIASVIIAGATGAVMNINRLLADTGRRTSAWDEAKRLEEFLIARAQGAGGGQLRPASSIFVEDARATALAPGAACRTIAGLPTCTLATQGADRLTVFTQRSDFPQCPVPDRAGVNIVVGPGSGACCLDDAPTANAFEGRQALLVGDNGNVVSIRIHNRTSAGGSANCSMNAPPGQGAGLLPSVIATAIPGTLIVADAETFFVDRDPASTRPHTLNVWTDLDGDTVADANEITTVHDRVYDMQLAPGYDGRPEDGKLVDSTNAADEFLYNSAADAAMPASVSVGQLRMLQIAIAVGTPSVVSGGNPVLMLNRSAPISVPGVYLTQASSKAFMRNLALFTQ